MAKVLALVGDLDGCALWRVLLPFSELQRQGYRGIEWGMRDDDRLAKIVHKFDAIILPRLHWPPAEREKSINWFKALHRAGKAIIYEIDDDMFSDSFIKFTVDVERFDLANVKERVGCIKETIGMCDGVTVSSQRLATMVREYTDKPVKVVPNYIDLRWFKKVQKQSERKLSGLTIGFAGGLRPDSDVEIMAQAWKRIADKYPKVIFMMIGHHAKVVFDTIPHERLAKMDWLPIDAYPAGLVNLDIGCCPLSDTKFNRAKTYIKAMEYAASGAAVVASPTVYSQIIENGKDGYIANTVDEWEQALSKLIEDYTLRHKMSKALLAKVRKHHSLEANAWSWTEAWNDIVMDYRQRRRNRIIIPREVSYALSN